MGDLIPFDVRPRNTLLVGDCLEQMRRLPDNSISAVVTDPPYGLGFMGKDWDSPGGVGNFPMRRSNAQNMVNTGLSRQGGRQRSTVDFAKRHAKDMRNFQAWCTEWAEECLRVLKPGGHLIAFGGSRTYHRLAAAIEDAGFEIRDQLLWIYASGFPKSRNLDGEWEGWGTALKPAHEPMVIARKSLTGTVAGNVLEHGTGAINIDGCRITVTDTAYARNHSGDRGHAGTRDVTEEGSTSLHSGGGSASDKGRWPANVILTDPVFDGDYPDEVVGGGQQKGGGTPKRRNVGEDGRVAFGGGWNGSETGEAAIDTAGGKSRFFMIPKASRKDRNGGVDGEIDLEAKAAFDGPGGQLGRKMGSRSTPRANNHPTVKPVELMRHLVRLVTPPGGLVIDPFAGSGTTGLAAQLEGFDWLIVEREEEYAKIIRARLGIKEELDLAA